MSSQPSKIGVGVIGVGRIGKLHIDNLVSRVPGVRVVRVADPNVSKSAAWLAERGITTVSADYRDVLRDPEVQAVFVCSSTSTHAQYSIEAARAGKHIFCEKPIDFDIGRIHTVLKEVAAANVTYQVGFNRRFDHNFRRIREAVEKGEVGSPHLLRITMRDPGYDINYIKESAKSGGIFYDMTIHDFDLARYITGMEVEEVYARGSALIDPRIGAAGDVDSAVVILHFKGGAMCVIDNSRQAAYGYDQRIEVFGSGGMALTPNDRPSLVEVYTKDAPRTDKIHHFFLERYQQAYVDEVVGFIDCVRNKSKKTLVNGNDGLAAVMIAAAARKSLLEKRPVRISEVATGVPAPKL